MAATSSQGGADTGEGGGGEVIDRGRELNHGGVGLGGGAEEGDCCGSSNPAAEKEVSPAASAAALALVWKEQPSQSNMWTTGLGGVE